MSKQVNSLPEGWTMKVKSRKTGQKDRFITDPVSGLVFRSFKEVDRFLKTGKVEKLALQLRDKAQSNKSAASSEQKLAESTDEQPNQCTSQGTVMPGGTMTPITSLKREAEALTTPLSSPKRLSGMERGPVSESTSPVEELIPQKLNDENPSGVSSINTAVGTHGFPQEEGEASLTAELSLTDLCSYDPCIEFAVKILTGDCPIVFGNDRSGDRVQVGGDENVDNNNITTNNSNASNTNTTTTNNNNEIPFSSLLQDIALGGFCAELTDNPFPTVEDVGDELNVEDYLQQDIEGGLAPTNGRGEVAEGVDTCLSTDLLAQHFDDAKGDDGVLNPDNCVAGDKAKEGEQQPGPSGI